MFQLLRAILFSSKLEQIQETFSIYIILPHCSFYIYVYVNNMCNSETSFLYIELIQNPFLVSILPKPSTNGLDFWLETFSQKIILFPMVRSFHINTKIIWIQTVSPFVSDVNLMQFIVTQIAMFYRRFVSLLSILLFGKNKQQVYVLTKHTDGIVHFVSVSLI